MRIAVGVGIISVMLILISIIFIGLESVTGRVVLGIAIVLLWTPVARSIDAIRARNHKIEN